MEGDSVTLGYASNDDGTFQTTGTKDRGKKDNKRKYSDEKMNGDINLFSEDDSLSESSTYYHTSEVEDDDDEGDDSNGDNGDQEEKEEEEDDHWDLDYSKWMDYSDWFNNDMIDDYTIIGVKDQLLYADILKHIRKHTIYWMQGTTSTSTSPIYNYANPEVGIETAKRRYRKAVDDLLVPSITNRDRWVSYKVRCKFLQAMREFLWTTKQHCERELFPHGKLSSFPTRSRR